MKTRILKRMGFVSDQQGIMNRYFREESNWDEHLKKTREFIVRSMSDKEKNTAVILGSGWLLDVPIQELSDTFTTVYLVDIVHPKQIKHKVSKFNNIVPVCFDITGGYIEQVYNLVKRYKKTKQKESFEVLVADIDNFGVPSEINADFVVSVNILNQLDILICDYLRKFDIYTVDELVMLRKQIQQLHTSSLPTNKSCLITDFEEVVINEEDGEEQKKNLLHVELPESKHKENWQWQFDMQKTYYKDAKTILNVIGIDI